MMSRQLYRHCCHYILGISKYLGLYDTINLSKTCQRLKNLAETILFKQISELTIDFAIGG